MYSTEEEEACAARATSRNLRLGTDDLPFASESSSYAAGCHYYHSGPAAFSAASLPDLSGAAFFGRRGTFEQRHGCRTGRFVCDAAIQLTTGLAACEQDELAGGAAAYTCDDPMVSTRLTQGAVEQCVAPGFGSPHWSDGWQPEELPCVQSDPPASLSTERWQQWVTVPEVGPPTYTLELGEAPSGPPSVALGAAMPKYEISAPNCGHKVYGDGQFGTYDASCQRMILCEGVSDCIASGITSPQTCAERAAVTAECEKDYIEFRTSSSHCFCNPAGRVWAQSGNLDTANVYPLEVTAMRRLYHVSFLTIRSDWWGKKPEEVKVERYDDAADEWVPFDQDKEEGWVPKKPNGDNWDAAYYGLTSCANQPSNGDLPQERVGVATLTGEEACRGHLNLKAVNDEAICGWPWQCCGGGSCTQDSSYIPIDLGGITTSKLRLTFYTGGTSQNNDGFILGGIRAYGCSSAYVRTKVAAQLGTYEAGSYDWSAYESASIDGDPHITGAHGDKADVKGEDGGIYSLLSAEDVSLAVRFEHDDFHTPYSKQLVHGSWVRAAFWVVRLPAGEGLLRVNYSAHAFGVAEVALYRDGARALWERPRAVRHGGAPVEVGGVSVGFATRRSALVREATALQQRRNAGRASPTLEVWTARWRTAATATTGWPHVGSLRLNVRVASRTPNPAARGRVAPHGLLGQTFDGDGVPLNGRQDTYTKKARGFSELTTHAAAEGAIEGTIEDYRLPSPFATAFRYSRFDAKGAVAPRNATAMHAGLVGPKARAPAWDPAGGVDKLVPHLNFVGSDLNRGRAGRRPKAKTAEACYSACAKTRGCAAFTFITSPGFNEKARHGHDRCWLKKAGFERGAEYSSGTISGVVGREG